MNTRTDPRSGFSLIELLVAMVILTVGLLGMAGGTGWMIRSVDVARIQTARAAAFQEAVERVRATPFAALAGGEEEFAGYRISWTVASPTRHSRRIDFVVVGPGRDDLSGGMPRISNESVQIFSYWMFRP